jgi:hypothetical protein
MSREQEVAGGMGTVAVIRMDIVLEGFEDVPVFQDFAAHQIVWLRPDLTNDKLTLIKLANNDNFSAYADPIQVRRALAYTRPGEICWVFSTRPQPA